MTDLDTIERRLSALERAVVDDDRPLTDLPDAAAVATDVERLESRLEDLDERVADLEGASRALRGYVGNVRSVNEDVERHADAAVATVDRLERRVADLERTVNGEDADGDATAEPRSDPGSTLPAGPTDDGAGGAEDAWTTVMPGNGDAPPFGGDRPEAVDGTDGDTENASEDAREWPLGPIRGLLS